MTQRRGHRVVPELGVPAQEAIREVGPAEVLEVHRQAADVVKTVEPAQPVVEVQAIQHPVTVIEGDDVAASRSPCLHARRDTRHWSAPHASQ
ncbi:MAG: hypothetical protein ABR608_10185 [Pseudonocardiaceae bacterium]